jgi:hypothetical protein
MDWLPLTKRQVKLLPGGERQLMAVQWEIRG